MAPRHNRAGSQENWPFLSRCLRSRVARGRSMRRRGRFGRISSGTMISRPTMAWLPITEETRCSPGLRRQATSRLEIDIDYWEVPVRVENLKPPLLLALKCLLVGEKLFLHSVLVDGINGCGGALEDQCDAIVPPAVLGGVVPRFDRGDFLAPASWCATKRKDTQDRRSVFRPNSAPG